MQEQALVSERRLRLPVYSREVGLAAIILITILVSGAVYGRTFFSFENLSAVLRNLAVDGILATGMMVLLVGGSFDLSVGALLSLVGVTSGWLMKLGCPVPLAVLAGLGIAALGGLANGVLVARLRVNALITTLGTMGIFRGLAVLIGGPGISFLPESFTWLGQSTPLGIQAPVWILAVVALLTHYLLAHTRFFRQFYYIGSNSRAALLSGINVQGMQVFGFTLMGLIAGIAGITFASRIGTAVSTAGDGAELRVITAAILGGASLTGGKGTIWGALIGVAFMALIGNVLIISRVSSYWQGIITGGVLVLAVAIDSLMSSRRR